jgi:hypothetical protein
MIIRNKLKSLLATIQSLDDGVIDILVFGGEPISVSFPPELHEVRAELEAHLEIVKPEMSLPRFLLDGSRSFYFERIKRTSGMPGLVDAKTCSIKEVLSSAVNELLGVIEKSTAPASESPICEDEISRDDTEPNNEPRARKRKKEIRKLLGYKPRQMTNAVKQGFHGLKDEGGQWCSLPVDVLRKLEVAKSSTK